MTKKTFLAAAAIAAALLPQFAPGGDAPRGVYVDELRGRVFPGDINVRDFGAKGDGVADDTAAIAAAGKAAQAHDLARRTDGLSGEYDGPHAAVVFPAGTYRVSDTVFFDRDAHLRGAGDARIVSSAPDRDIFYFHKAARTRVENLRFSGGRNQLNVTTLNHENANLVVRGCTFEGATSNAIRSVSRKSGDTPVGEFMPDAGGRFAPDPRYAGAKRYNNSTFAIIEGCTFIGCAHAVDVHTDGTVVRSCRVEQPAVPGGAFRSSTAVHIYDIDVVVERAAGVEQCVLQTYSTSWAALENVNVRTTDGSGVLFVDSDATTGWVIPSTLFVRNCRVECGGCPEGAIVRFREGKALGMLLMDGVSDVSGRSVRALAFEKEFTEAGLEELSRRTGRIPLEKKFVYSFGRLSPNVDTGCGPLFGRFVRKYPADLPGPAVARRPLRAYTGPLVLAADFGLGKGGGEDDTDAMERFVAALAARPGSVGVLPGEWISLSRPVVLDGDFALVGSGTAGFRHLGRKDVAFFRVANGAKVKFKNIYFWDTRHVVLYSEKSAKPTYIALDNCFAFNSTRYDAYKGAAFDVFAEENPGAVEFTVTAGSYYQAKLYRGNARALFDGFWFRSLPEPAPEEPLVASRCFINEEGGALQLVDMLGVPCTLRKLGWKASNDASCKKGDFRWIDNHGECCTQLCRYGGEYGGLTPVYNFGRGKVYVEGAYAEYKAFSCRQAMVYSDGDGGDIRAFGVILLSRPPLPEHDARIRYDSTMWLRQ